jgi:hypothetical protein
MQSRPPKLPHDVRTHFINRLKERFGIEFTKKECKQLEKRHEGLFLQRESLSRAWYLEKINGQWVYCLYQRNLGYTTVLTAQQFWVSHPDVKLPFRVAGRLVEARLVAGRHQQIYKNN